MHRPPWFGFMLLCHLNGQKGDGDQGDNIIIRLKEASHVTPIFSVIVVSLISEAAFPLEDFLYG